MEKEQDFSRYLQETTVFINGENFPAKEARISVFDRGFLFGDSIYEACYGEDGFILFFDDHINRLKHSAKLLKFTLYTSVEEIKKQAIQTLSKSGLKSAYLRIILTRGESKISLDPNQAFKNNLVTIARPKPVYPKEYYLNGVYLSLVNTIRNDIRAVDPNAKSGNYLNNVMAIEEAKAQGAYDAIMLNSEGKVTEGTTFNLWIVKNGKIITPPIESGLLAGITRKNLLILIKTLGLNHAIEEIHPADLFSAQEVFITSSTRKIIPVARIDDKIYGDNTSHWPTIANLMHRFDELIQTQPAEYKYL
ncbi:MAG: branched-chain amino acid aminotransferase [Halobacteriovoraceae bacterium]|nr:branched-chain amino acid aminotransferase [Halobacteriovoraceae bacterium]